MPKILEKSVGDVARYCIDFRKKLASAEHLLAIQQVIVDPHPLAIDDDSYAVDGPKAFFDIGRGGVPGTDYVLTLRATTNGGRTVEGVGLLRIIKPPADLFIVQGDDYLAADGRNFQFQGSEDWPDLTDLTPVLTIKSAFLASEIRVDGTVEEATGSEKKVAFDLESGETSQLKAGGHRYDVSVGDIMLVGGFAVVKEDQST